MMHELFAPFTSLRQLRHMLLLTGIYLLFALPFSAMEFIPTFTNLRPVSTLVPVYGIFFGPEGAWAYAIGNLLYDFFSGTLVLSSIGGFVGNFVAAGLFWAFSRRFMHDGHLLGSIKTFVCYAAVSAFAALAVAGMVMFWVAFFLAGVDAVAVGQSIFGNDLFFFLMPGVGVAILMSTEFGCRPAVLSEESLGERRETPAAPLDR